MVKDNNKLNRYYHFLKEHLGKRYHDTAFNTVHKKPIIEFCGIYYNKSFREYFFIIGTNDSNGICYPILRTNLLTNYGVKIFKKMKYYSEISCSSPMINEISCTSPVIKLFV